MFQFSFDDYMTIIKQNCSMITSARYSDSSSGNVRYIALPVCIATASNKSTVLFQTNCMPVTAGDLLNVCPCEYIALTEFVFTISSNSAVRHDFNSVLNSVSGVGGGGHKPFNFGFVCLFATILCIFLVSFIAIAEPR